MTLPRGGPGPKVQEIDGWLTDDPKEYEFFTQRARGWTVLKQLQVDVRSWKPWAFWVAGATVIVRSFFIGGTEGSKGSLALGFAIWAAYLWMLLSVVRSFRRMRLLEAVVREFNQAHPMAPRLLLGTFEAEDGRVRGRACCSKEAVTWLAREDGSLEALIAFDAEAEVNRVVGIRPPPMR